MTPKERQGTCELLTREGPFYPFCGLPAVERYPTEGGGFMRLCEIHAAKHVDSERWDPDAQQWRAPNVDVLDPEADEPEDV